MNNLHDFSIHVYICSGIGPAKHLKEFDIPIVRDLPAVGSNLVSNFPDNFPSLISRFSQQDHFAVSVAYNTPVEDSIYVLQARPWIFLKELFIYLIWGTGLLMLPLTPLAIFMNSRLLNEQGVPAKSSEVWTETEKLPDFEIMPVCL